ncbi:alpha-2,8-sialyltransferase 8B-like [Branchiostoma floridae]|uniref:Alpha-2,8-sialyltransferase 8B-like n=1 Tax=Branchiostoma floridae TaxID=7739 RepID=A0A9J7MHH1_BRAFL|nr:alpha-2,8-sialyltransferase 8B-like [Branchiostoma floridae]
MDSWMLYDLGIQTLPEDTYYALTHSPAGPKFTETATSQQQYATRPGVPTKPMLLARDKTTPAESGKTLFPAGSDASSSAEELELRRIRNATSKLHPDKKFRRGPHWPKSCLRKTKSKKPCPPSDYKIGHYRTCAVVGNGGILLGSHCGADIDAKGYVIRIDVPAVTGFEKDVGQRTDMTVLNMDTPKRLEISSGLKNRSMDRYESRLRKINGTVLLAHRKSHPYLKKASQRYHVSFVLLTSASTFKSATRINPIASKIARKRYRKNHPSTGMATVLIATTFCDRLFLYGFFPFDQDEKQRPHPYHYYPDDGVRQKPIAKDKKHHMDAEYKFYKGLNQSSRGVLKLHIGECGNL